MKKLIYTFLAISIIFSACKKEEGCTDPIAINYDSSAEENDGSCIYAIGCTDTVAINYDPNSIVDDGSCLYQCTDPYATNYLVPTTYHVCEYEADVVFYLTVAGAQYMTNQGVPFLDVYVGNDLAGSMPTNAGFTSAVLCTDTDPDPVHFIYLWENALSTTLTWSVRDLTGYIWYEGTDLVVANNCLSLGLDDIMIKTYQNTH